MGLKEALEQKVYKADNRCSAATFLESLPKGDKELVMKALEDGVATIGLVGALRSEGYKIAEWSLNNHRKGRCKCPTK